MIWRNQEVGEKPRKCDALKKESMSKKKEWSTSNATDGSIELKTKKRPLDLATWRSERADKQF